MNIFYVSSTLQILSITDHILNGFGLFEKKKPWPQETRNGLWKQTLIQRSQHRRIVFVKSKNHRLIKWLNKVHITTPLRNVISCFGNPGTVDNEYVNDWFYVAEQFL